ncbi:MAG: thermonuclease family protein [Deltaproteobacteria bacterium]|nr:thermonuclease family protein [Deltaproteobacteria bacterium]
MAVWRKKWVWIAGAAGLAAFALVVLLVQPRVPDPRLGDARRQRAVVEKVHDGDTIRVRLLSGGGGLLKVRLRGIDCPESRHNAKCERDADRGRRGCDWQVPRGEAATRRAVELLEGRTVQLECDGPCRKGSFGRALRYVRLEDGRDFGLEMIRDGFCEDFSFRYPHPRGQQYLRIQREAKTTRRGIWR